MGADAVRAMVPGYGRQLGGFDFTAGLVDVYLNEAGTAIEMLRGDVSALCPEAARLKASGKEPTQADVRAAYGDPFSVATIGSAEFWFYSDEAKSSALVFRFGPDKPGAVTKVYATRFDTAVRQWAPHLGATEGPKPLSQQDAAVGPLLVGMDADAARNAVVEEPSEGRLSPYSKLIYEELGIELHHDTYVRAVYSTSGSAQTPRGIAVGSPASSVKAAYGEPRVAVLTDTGEVWAYTSLVSERALLFWIKDSRVNLIAAFDTNYSHRPYQR